MKSRLLHILIFVGVLAATVLAGFTSPASAEKRTIYVKLATGQVVPVTVDVPPGTPLESIPLPGTPVTPTTPSEPPKTEPTDPPPPTTTSPAPNARGGEQQPSTTGPKKNTRPKKKQKKRRTRRKRRKNGTETGGVRARPEVERKRRRRGNPLRRPDGAPMPSNPGFVDALPGPSTRSGVPNFIIRKFRVPVFLLPIYQAAGIQYGIRWEILAAINEIETDYGRNLNVSSAGALGWMQFMPSSWRLYGVDANKDKRKDPYNPVDAIFAAARYLKAAGYAKDVRRAIFAYNHADWYVDSVMLRARLIAGVPADLVGSLTGLTEGRFPVYARARYADDLAERDALKRVKRGQNAAHVVESNDSRRGIEIFTSRGAPAVATNDGVIKKIGRSSRLGRYVVLQDVYGNRYTYAHLGSVARYHPVPKEDAEAAGKIKAVGANSDPRPNAPASAGRQSEARDRPSPRRKRSGRRGAAPRASVPVKKRLFANPNMAWSRQNGGLEQMLDRKSTQDGFTSFKNYFSRPFGMNSRDVRLRRLRVGSHVIGGTILGRIGKTEPSKAPHLYFEIRPAGRGAPRIDPKPILDGWKLLEATAIYRASGRNALYGRDSGGLSIGQVLLLPKPLLEKRVLHDPRVEIYPGGRQDIRSGQVDRRVLATLEYLAEAGLKPTVTSLKSGHGFLTKSGNVSEHSSGNAVDIAKVNGIPIIGHQERGGITEQTVRMLMRLQGTMRPHQVISLLDFGANTMSLGDHDDHIHVGFRPLFGDNKKLGKQALAVLKPGQWSDLLSRLRRIDNPVVPTKPSRYAIPVRPTPRRSSLPHRGE
jgi:Transglycosylase SLT domain